MSKQGIINDPVLNRLLDELKRTPMQGRSINGEARERILSKIAAHVTGIDSSFDDRYDNVNIQSNFTSLMQPHEVTTELWSKDIKDLT